MQIPIANQLKKRAHLEIAMLQDELVRIIYEVAPRAVFHGGTSIWRCYGGNRFSEDIHIYANVGDNFKEQLSIKLKTSNLTLTKYKQTENVIFSKISDGRTEVRLEINWRLPKGEVVRTYHKADDSSISVFTLSPEALFMEKLGAYSSRKLIRDVYDIYHLSNLVDAKKLDLVEVRKQFGTLPDPVDEKNLRTIVYSGAVPTFKQMVELLRARFST